MRTSKALLLIAALFALPQLSTTASAAGPKPRVRVQTQSSNSNAGRSRFFSGRQSRNRLTPEQLQRKQELATARKIGKEKTESRRNFARFFKKITQKRDYSGEYVFKRNKHVTAFLDMSDPKHPKFDSEAIANEESMMAGIPKQKRAHILVIPNQHREHISSTLNGHITPKDLAETSRVMKEAQKIAAERGIKNPKIWINSENRISIGYLHVHIVGERSASLPPAM